MPCDEKACSASCGKGCARCCCADNAAHWIWHVLYIILWVSGFAIFLGIGIDFAVQAKHDARGGKIAYVQEAVSNWTADTVNGYLPFSSQNFTASLDFTCGTSASASLRLDNSRDAYTDATNTFSHYPVRRYSMNTSIPLTMYNVSSVCRAIVSVMDTATHSMVASMVTPLVKNVTFGANEINGNKCPSIVGTVNRDGAQICADKAGTTSNGKTTGQDGSYSACRINCESMGGVFSCDGTTGRHTCVMPTYTMAVCVKVSTASRTAPFLGDQVKPFLGYGCGEPASDVSEIPALLAPSVESLSLTRPANAVNFKLTVRSSHDPYLAYLQTTGFSKSFGPTQSYNKQMAAIFLSIAGVFFLAGVGLELGYLFAKRCSCCGPRGGAESTTYNKFESSGPVTRY